jgi:hypothetical protein
MFVMFSLVPGGEQRVSVIVMICIDIVEGFHVDSRCGANWTLIVMCVGLQACGFLSFSG